jgi:hypothetical protein
MSLLDKASLIVTPNAYKASKLYSVVPNTTLGDMTVVRATTATRVNSSSLIESVAINIPRIDYTNGSCPSLLVEPQRTNLLTYSNTFSNAAWIKLNCSVASNSIISPDGTQNSSTLTSSVTNTNYLYNAITTANGLYTLSCFVKYLDTNTVNLSMTDFATGDASAKFNFNTGLFNTPIVSGSWTNTTTNVITLTNGWFKISITSQKNAGLSVSSRIDSFAIGKSVYIYGAQLELGSYQTSYIPTVASSVTRNADVISKTGISSLIGQTEGTIYYEFSVPLVENITRALSVSGSDTNNRINISTFSSSIFVRVDVGGANQVNSSAAITVTNMNKVALRYKANDFSLYVNGVNVITDTSGITFPAATLDRISNIQPDSSSPFNGTIKQITLFKTALTNAELQSLTSL